MTNTSEPETTSYVRLRRCPNPNNFFDEIIPNSGLNIGDWHLKIHKIPTPVFTHDEKNILVDVAWLYAESNYDETQLTRFKQDKLPSFTQIIRALGGIRRMHLSGGVEFSMSFDEFVKNGVSRNIEPYRINVGVDILRVQITDINGTIIFDDEAEAAERARRALQDAQNELLATAKVVTKHLGDDFFRRAWESFNLAFGKDEHAINHLYDVRDAVFGKFGKEEVARDALGIHKKEWSEFGRIFNVRAVIGGRHNGKHPAPLKPMTHDERTQAIRFAKNLLQAYGRYLDNQME